MTESDTSQPGGSSAVIERSAVPWHGLDPAEALERLRSSREGLSAREAERRLEEYGPNTLRVARPTPVWRLLYDQVKSLVVLLLFGAAVGALLFGDVLEAGAIAAVLVVNIVIGFWVEWKAREEMAALRRMQVQEARVLRDGTERQVDARDLVPGDVIVIEAGSAIPADARLISATELRVVEAPLTGESLPVSKLDRPVSVPEGEEVPLAERSSMIYKGTLAAAGSGRAVVVGTGVQTEIGRISELVQETETERTPLERRLDALGRRLVWITLGVAAVVSAMGILRGRELWLMIETGIALAIAAVPEGLPVVATITLALGMRRMARRNALVRRLPAVETLGSATVICTDKTGTLTAGQMTVTVIQVAGQRIEVTGRGYAPEGGFRRDGRRVEPEEVPGLDLALRIGALANRARLARTNGDWDVDGDPTEAALLVAARKAGYERERILKEYPEEAEIPFSSERMLMATFHRTPAEGRVAYVKGAPGRLVERSVALLTPDGVTELDDAGRRELLEMNNALAGEGLRILALAYREAPGDEVPTEEEIHELTFVGFAGILDPPAEGVKQTIRRFRDAGVRTVMITGDQEVTAEAVARDLGVLEPGEQLIHGREMARLSADELKERVGSVGTFARVSPEDKLKIVEAYRGRGDIVAMLGDGVNDAPALKRADIGVAMGRRGTDVAKETSAVVLQDDRFETIGTAVEEGRVIFDNIRKFIFYLFSCNLSEVLVLFVAGLAGLPLPLLPLQILWLNLVTDVFPALALAVEPPEPDVMQRPPRDPGRAILSRSFMTLVGGYGVVLTITTLAVFLWALEVWQLESDHAVTLAFMTLALTQLFHVFNARSTEQVVFSRRFFENRWVWGAVLLTVGLQLAAVYAPGLSRVLRTQPLRPVDWAVVTAASLLPLLLGQIWEVVSRRLAASRERAHAVANS